MIHIKRFNELTNTDSYKSATNETVKTQTKQVISGNNFCRNIRQIVDKDGNVWDLSNTYIKTPQKHHKIIETEDGYKFALNINNGICYKILGEKYQ